MSDGFTKTQDIYISPTKISWTCVSHHSSIMSPLLTIFSPGIGVRMWLLWALLFSLVSASSAGADSKAVTTTLTTKWADTPLLLEARYNSVTLHCFKSAVAATLR